MATTYRYYLIYKADSDDALDEYLDWPVPVKLGDVVKVDYGFFQHVRRVGVGENGPELELAQSAQSEAEAPHMPP